MADPPTVRPSAVGLPLNAGQPIVTAFNPLSDDNPCYALVGLIAAEQARIEYLLDHIIWNLSEDYREVAARQAGPVMGMPIRYDAIENVMRGRGIYSDYEDRLNQQRTDSRPLGEARNRAIHDPWFEESTTGGSYQHRTLTRKSASFGTVPVTVSDLQNTFSAFRKLRDEVMDLRGDVWAATHP